MLEALVMTLIVLAVVGIVCWVIVTYVPMPAPIHSIIIAIAAIACLLYALRSFGVLRA